MEEGTISRPGKVIGSGVDCFSALVYSLWDLVSPRPKQHPVDGQCSFVAAGYPDRPSIIGLRNSNPVKKYFHSFLPFSFAVYGAPFLGSGSFRPAAKSN